MKLPKVVRERVTERAYGVGRAVEDLQFLIAATTEVCEDADDDAGALFDSVALSVVSGLAEEGFAGPDARDPSATRIYWRTAVDPIVGDVWDRLCGADDQPEGRVSARAAVFAARSPCGH